ncbi:MAG: GDSL-type esterase/lipase family protein [Bacteroidota bacterium]
MKLHLLLLLGFTSFVVKKNEVSDTLYYEEFNVLENVSPQLLTYLQEIKANKNSGIDIFHLGDSHVQIGEFSKGILNVFAQKELSIQKSWYLPNLIFDDLSFTNKSLKAISGDYSDEKITHKTKSLNVGLTGRTFRFEDENTTLKFKFQEKLEKMEFLHSKNERLTFEMDKNLTIKSTFLNENQKITQIGLKNFKSKLKLSIPNQTKELVEFYAIRHNFVENQLSYSNFGVSGAKFSDFIFAPKFMEQLEALKPEIMIFTLGTNDSYYYELDHKQFTSDLESFIDKIKELSPKTELIFMSAPDTYFKNSKPKHLSFINSEIERISKVKNCAFWNWNKIMGGENSIHLWNKQNFADKDLLHLTSKGYLLLGKLFGEAFLK